jgi:hypothetical protein
MKKIITIVAALVLVLAFVTAFADEMPIFSTVSKDAGNMLYLEEAPGHAHPKRIQGDLLYEPKDVISPTARKDFSGPLVEEKLVDSGTALYESAFETNLVEPGITGMAAGGVGREDKNTRIWDNLMGPPGGSELP